VFGKARSIKIGLLQAPQNDAATRLSLFLQGIYRVTPDSPGDRGGKPRGGRTVLLIGAGAADFMQRAQGQPAARQSAVDRGDAKRQYAVMRRIRLFDAPDAVLQIDEVSRR
jgi:hypothetical protein